MHVWLSTKPNLNQERHIFKDNNNQQLKMTVYYNPTTATYFGSHQRTFDANTITRREILANYL